MAGGAFVGADATGEQPLRLFGVDAGTVVPDPEDPLSAILAGGDMLPMAAPFVGVVEQIAEDFEQVVLDAAKQCGVGDLGCDGDLLVAIDLRQGTQQGQQQRRHCGRWCQGGAGGGRMTEPPKSDAPTLADMGIAKSESTRYQKLAPMDEEHFESAVEIAKHVAGEVTTAHMLRAGWGAIPSP